MLKILKRPQAKEDIKNIWRYTYHNWGEKQADAYTKELGQTIGAIANNPKIGITIDHIVQGYRLLHFKHHLVIYRITPVAIEVVRVLGENMNTKQHLETGSEN